MRRVPRTCYVQTAANTNSNITHIVALEEADCSNAGWVSQPGPLHGACFAKAASCCVLSIVRHAVQAAHCRKCYTVLCKLMLHVCRARSPWHDNASWLAQEADAVTRPEHGTLVTVQHSVSYFAEAPLRHHNPATVRHVVYNCVLKVRHLVTTR